MSFEKVIIGNAELYCGDCFEFMESQVNDIFDHVITDPPYGQQTHSEARTGKGDKVLINFDSITNDQFLQLCSESVRLAKRWVVMTCEWRHAAKLEESDLPLVRLGVWHKPNGAPQFTGDRPGTGWEAIAILHRKGRKKWNGGGHHAVWSINKTEGEHPTQKPLLLIRTWIEQFTDKGDTVFDPFMGSGTTGVGCVDRDRKFIGIELEPKYFDVACRRIEQAQQQLKLF